MNKLKTNIIIDVLLLASMAVVSSSGYLLDEVVRRGVTFMGMGRRTWIDIHLWSGVIIVVLLVLHIIFHWKTINGFFTKHIPNKALRYTTYAILLALVLITAIPWLFKLK
ncbi:MAG: DUF4405 domain-containing protein [Alistipes sp.]|nr:DUF4405 domain-containing protein [Alistipes sp.]